MPNPPPKKSPNEPGPSWRTVDFTDLLSRGVTFLGSKMAEPKTADPALGGPETDVPAPEKSHIVLSVL